MLKERLDKIIEQLDSWQFPAPVEDMPHSDMPGDKVIISDALLPHAQKIFRLLVKMMAEKNDEKYVISIFGGSGSGKSVTTSLLTYYLNNAGIKTYALAGDNYPRRIPMYNDAERLSIFRSEGLKGLLKENAYSKDAQAVLDDLWKKEIDSDPKEAEQYPWLAIYQKYGREGLKGYLGEDKEQDYSQINWILNAFKEGAERKRDQQQLNAPVGRDPADRPLQQFETPGLDRDAVEEDDVEHDPADREEADDDTEQRRADRHASRHGEDNNRDDVGDDQRDDRSDMRLDLAARDQHQQRDNGDGSRDRRQRGIPQRVIDLIPHCSFLPTSLLATPDQSVVGQRVCMPESTSL